MRPKPVSVLPAVSVKKEPKEDTCRMEYDTVTSESDGPNDTNNELRLLGSVMTANAGNKVKKKKKLLTKELIQKKLAAQQEEQV